LAILAKAHEVPFYVAAAMTTVDPETPSGSHIVVEERPPEEVSSPMGVSTTPNGINIFNPAFDVTPASYVTAIVTEKGIFTPPYIESFVVGANRHG
ncbi:MAG: S-methyl-5-thioribose-1-phosphate isomerase, partial [Chloroflexota bacterium]|nr:S-methyl-5-thioribose-1-phosphate isomerase [Chloroflexota bacterium]